MVHSKFAVIVLALTLAGCGAAATTNQVSFERRILPTTSGPPAAAGASTTVTSTTVPAELCPGTGTTVHRDLPYDAIEGVDPILLSLDVYEPRRDSACPPAPIMVYAHGGGWRQGEKEGNERKAEWFNEMGWVFVSINYRLSPPASAEDRDPERLRWPAHNEDAATAFAWVRDNSSLFGGDPTAMSVMGHSAGGGIVSAIATDGRYLAKHGLRLDSVTCAVSLDSVAVDVLAGIETPFSHDFYLNAFGDDPAIWDEASPLNHVEAGKGTADFLVVAAGPAFRIEPQREFVDALLAVGIPAELLIAGDMSHAGVSSEIGSPDDDVITPTLHEFLARCGRAVPPQPAN